MKTFLGSFGIILMIFVPAFITQWKLWNSSEDDLKKVQLWYIAQLDTFQVQSVALKNAAAAYLEKELSTAEIREQLIETRLSYKRTEIFTAYFQPEFVNNYINGAPLPKVDPNIPAVEVIPPCGLQTLDELVFADDPQEHAEEIYHLAGKLLDDMKSPIAYCRVKPFQHRYIFEAARTSLLSLYTLGLTGFDTPGSVNAIPEAIAVLESALDLLNSYEGFVYKHKQEGPYDALRVRYLDFLKFMKENDDFDTLDRMYVLREFINPLYMNIFNLQKSLHVDLREEVDPTMSAVNDHAEFMFSDDFLYPPFYARIADVDLSDPKKVELGKLLFFDPVLSRNLDLSCASCHHPDKAFTDGKKRSIQTKETITRNAPTLINAVYSPKYFLDLREYDLERQVKHVVYDKHEFNMDFVELADRLKESSEYLALFEEAYGDRDRYGISPWSISNSLAAYVASLRSWNSPFDQYARGETAYIDQDVIEGYNLFMGKAACGTCHFAPAFNGTVPPAYREAESEVLGVIIEYDTINPELDNDPGRIANGRARDEAPQYLRSFKTVTVRNVQLTGPYMHNGGFSTLEEVMDFYNRGGGAGMGLDVPHQTLPDVPLELSQTEINQIITFMNALTDTTGLTSQPGSLPAFESHPYWNDRHKVY